MTHIATIDEVRQGAVLSRPDSADLEGLAPAEDDGSYPATGRSDTTGPAPPMPQRSPSPRRGRRRLAWVAGVALVALAAIAGQRAWQSEGSPRRRPRHRMSRSASRYRPPLAAQQFVSASSQRSTR